MEKIVIVGSGASGVHFALSLLKKGYDVTMLDVGNSGGGSIHTQDSITGLKTNLKDPVGYFLGRKFEAYISPDHKSEYYGFPPSKNHVFLKPTGFDFSANGFEPLFSFAQGGLAEAWTGGAYPLNDEELADFPFSYDDIRPYYQEVAHRIGISGTQDDLSAYYPFHDNIIPAPDLDPNSDLLMKKYLKRKEVLNSKFNLFCGRSRVATLSHDKGDRHACNSSGRCLWGCPQRALYTPSITLEECKTYDNFQYLPSMYVQYFTCDETGRIKGVVSTALTNRKKIEFSLDVLVLAAGTLSSSRIFMESIYRKTGEIIRLKGLMDNRQVLIPFLNLHMMGKPVKTDSYQYHKLALCMRGTHPKKSVHGQITTLKSALIHPIIKSIPFDIKTAICIFQNFHSSLGLVNLNFHDFRRDTNYVSLKAQDVRSNGEDAQLEITYKSMDDENQQILGAVKKIKKTLWQLGCVVPPGMIHVRPMGSSVHYCGTIPMDQSCSSYTVSKFCKSNDFKNLYFADGTTFPFLPAKNLTFTLMANAVRVAEKEF